MKLLFYMNSVHKGGAERVMKNLAGQFSKDGNKTYFLTSFRDKCEYPLDLGVKRITIDDALYKRSFLHKNVIWTAKLRKIIKQIQPDVVISFMAEPNFRTLIACAGLKCAKVISIRNDPNKEYPNALYRFLAKHLYKCADGVVFQTEEAREWFPKSIAQKSEIILNQVDKVFYDYVHKGERKGIVTTGRLAPQKNHNLLIDAFNLIKDKTDENLTIYGEGELRDKLQKKIDELGLAERVFLPGNSDEVVKVVGSARLFVLSSDFEGMPNSLMEAMALGTPCISTDCPCKGPEMLSQGGKSCVLVPVGDKEKLAQSMLEVLSDEQKAESLSEQAKKRAEDFNPENVFCCWKKYIEKVVGIK